MAREFYTRRLKTLFPYFLLALAVIAAFQVMNNLPVAFGAIGWIWGVVTPFFYGFLLAYVVSIPAGGIERLLGKTNAQWIVKRKKALSIPLVFLLFLLLLSLVLNLVIPAIFQNISYFIAMFPTHYENALGLIRQLNDLDLFGLHIDTDGIMDSFWEWVQGIGLDTFRDPINAVIDGATAFFGGVFRGFIALISSIYILVERDKFKAYLQRLIRAFTSASVYKAVIKYTSDLNRNFKQYIYTQTLDGLILGTVSTIALTIMNSPFALVLGIMLGILNYVPYFGSIVATLVAIAVVTFTQGLTMGIIAAIVLLVIQQIDANIIQPKLMSGSFSMSPLLIIISISVGGAIAGIMGMIAAIPIVAVLRDMLDNLIAYCEWRKSGSSDEQEETQDE